MPLSLRSAPDCLNQSASTLVRRHTRKITILATLGDWLVYYPPFRMGSEGRWKRSVMGVMAGTGFLQACLSAVALSVAHEHRSISIPALRRTSGISCCRLSVWHSWYIIHGLQDPAQIISVLQPWSFVIWRGSYTAGIMYSISWAGSDCSGYFCHIGFRQSFALYTDYPSSG